MTALEKYQRLEAAALWRDGPAAEPCEVILSLGDATITISDRQDRPLTHWSISALSRANPGALPATYFPDGDADQTLELAEDETEMLAALETLRSAVARRRPQKGRVRLGVVGGIAAGLLALGLFWLPGVLRSHALSVLPQVKRDEIGRQLFDEIQTLTGPPCAGPGGAAALALLADRITPDGALPPDLYVMGSGVQDSLHLPGNLMLLSRSVVEDHEDPEIVAGYVVAEYQRARAGDPVERLLREGGITSTLRLLTTGELSPETLDAHARTLVATAPQALPAESLLDGFAAAGIQSRPYAYAVDPTGEDTLELIEADPYPTGAPDPVLRDSDWLRLQAICGG